MKFTTSFDLTYGNNSAAEQALVAKNFSASVTLSLPGSLGETNGEVHGDEITWNLTSLKSNNLVASYTSKPIAADPIEPS